MLSVGRCICSNTREQRDGKSAAVSLCALLRRTRQCLHLMHAQGSFVVHIGAASGWRPTESRSDGPDCVLRAVVCLGRSCAWQTCVCHAVCDVAQYRGTALNTLSIKPAPARLRYIVRN